MKNMKLTPRQLQIVQYLEADIMCELDKRNHNNKEYAEFQKNKWYWALKNTDTDCGIIYAHLTIDMIFNYLKKNNKAVYDAISEMSMKLDPCDGLLIYVKFENNR